MNHRYDYEKLINHIESSKQATVTITQEKAKQIAGDELPKSCFNAGYLRQEKNALARYLKESGYTFEIVNPKLIIHKNKNK